MKLVLESDGTLEGTTVEFSMSAGELPRMVEMHKRRLRRTRPADIVDVRVAAAPVESAAEDGYVHAVPFN